MKLWIVIYIGSQIGGSVGPLPYGMEECQVRAAAVHAELQAKIALGVDKNGHPAPKSVLDTASQMRFVCSYSDSRPVITYSPRPA